ncbi:uncharacterized protein LOC130207369 [Pseudoliparis swirei]|uniref:uncharacterized protein LOC130207369 n=1 Tax=Pseudoliparis swirei TaxID=2059687 RepID=UPI0024BE86C6|nr:uncharacterized protein LOC130207369 [Pseudoliparis swirei]
MDTSFFNVLLSTTCSRCSSWQPMMEPAFLTSLLRRLVSPAPMLLPSRQWQSAAHWPQPTVLMLAFQFSRLSMETPRYWSSSTMSTSTPRTLRGVGAVAFLLKSTTISLVLATFSRRWFSSAHFTKSLTTALSSSSRPSLIHPTTAESSEYFCRWHDSVLYWKSLVYRVKRKGDRTVPCGAPTSLTTVPDSTRPILTNCGL